jgi:hypothetical protein
VWLGLPSSGLSPKHKELVFWLFLLSNMTSGPFSWWYFLLLTQRFFWYYFGCQVMAILCCVAQKAASAAQKWSLASTFWKNSYFVLSPLLGEMSSYVSFFTLKYFNLDLEGYYAFNEKLPGRSKIRIKTYFGYSGRHQVHMNFQPLGLKIIRLGIGGV